VLAGEPATLGSRRFVPLLRTSDSYMSLGLPEFAVSGRTLLGVELEFRPLSSSDGLLLYAGQTHDGRGDYLALAVVDHRVQLRSAPPRLYQYYYYYHYYYYDY